MSELAIRGVPSEFHQTLDRIIRGGGGTLKAPSRRAHDSLPLGWGSGNGAVCDGVHIICSTLAQCDIRVW